MHNAEPPTTSDSLREQVVDALLALARARLGDKGVRLEPSGRGAVRALLAGVNGFLRSSTAEFEQADSFQKTLHDKLAQAELQRGTIGEFPAPVIEVWRGVLCVPVVGLMDAVRSARMTEAILAVIAKREVRAAIIELSEIDTMDTETVVLLRKMATAVALLGSRCVLAGLTPPVAQTVIQMGVDMSGITVYRSLADALKPYVLESRANV